MNPNRLPLFISFLLICKANKLSTSKNLNVTDTTLLTKDCSNLTKSSLDIVSIEKFQFNMKQDLYYLNCTQSGIVNFTVFDLENPKNGSFAVSSDKFCTAVQKVTSWKTFNLSSFDHLAKTIFRNQTLCILVCTMDLNKSIWPYCEAIRNVTQGKASLENENKVPSKIKNEVSNQSMDNMKRKNDDVGRKDLLQPKKVPSNAKEEEILEDGHKDENDLEQIPAYPGKEKLSDSNKKNLKQEIENPSSKVEAQSASSINPLPSRQLPQTAMNLGKTDLNSENDESHYFIYFVVISILCILFYIGIYNKKKILALMIEGRKQKDRRRHASAGYRKLNTNLDEVMPLGTSAPASDSMIY